MTPTSRLHSGFRARAFAILSCILIAACSRGRADQPAVVIRDSAGIAIVDNDLLALAADCRVDTVPALRIGVAEGEPEHELHRVFGATRLGDGRLALVNQGTQEVRFYDSLGTFLGRAGRPGEGPGEFRNAFYLWNHPGDTLYVGDYRPWQFLVFDPQGKWIRSVRPEPFYTNVPEAISVLADGQMVLGRRTVSATGDTDWQLRHTMVFVHAADGTVRDTLGTYPDGRWGTVDNDPNAVRLFPLFESFTRIVAGGSRIVVGHTSRPELLIYSTDGGRRLERLVRWTGPDRQITSAEVDAERLRITEPYKTMEPGMRSRLVDPLVSEKRPIADEFPAFSRLGLGRDGRLWMREYRRPTMPAVQRWVAFDSLGRFLCRTEFPLRQDLLEIGGDYFLVHDRDEEGVERVLQYRIAQPSGH